MSEQIRRQSIIGGFILFDNGILEAEARLVNLADISF
jgi:hypothetical protein